MAAMKRTRLRRFAEDSDGAALVEFAFMFPVLVMILMMTISLSHMMMIDRKVTFAAQAAADLMAQRQAVDNDDIVELQRATELMMRPFAANFDLSVAHVPFDDASGDPDMDAPEAWRATINGADQLTNDEVEDAAGGANISAPSGAMTGAMGRPGDALVMVRLSYQYQSLWVSDFSFFGINIPGTLTFTKDTYARPRLIRRVEASSTLFVVN